MKVDKINFEEFFLLGSVSVCFGKFFLLFPRLFCRFCHSNSPGGKVQECS